MTTYAGASQSAVHVIKIKIHSSCEIEYFVETQRAVCMYHTQLAKMSFDKYSISQLEFFLI